MLKMVAVGVAALFFAPALAWAAGGPPIATEPWPSIPFVLLLLAIALLPLAAGHFWHHNRNKALVVAVLSLPVVVFLLMTGPAIAPEPGSWETLAPDWLQPTLEQAGTHALLHGLAEYAAFMVLLASLYTVSGGIMLSGTIRPTPWNNAAFLGCGVLLANLIGTTGASMLMIRPVLKTNRERRHVGHITPFFIFLVSNLGGLLTPLGDPPLFLGFLNGVDFFWTLSLWPQWLLANGVVLGIFMVWDALAHRKEQLEKEGEHANVIEPMRLRGGINFLFLAGIIVAAVLQSPHIAGVLTGAIQTVFPCPSLQLSEVGSIAIMTAMALGSLLATPRGVRKANDFSWGAIVEVAILFLGIFITMVPALAYLAHHGPSFGVSAPWEYFWLSGGLSSFLDNAPTYMTFVTLAAGEAPIGSLMDTKPLILQAISCGAVFMGANTYIGNGPNFMVKAIADQAGFKTPSFFGYMAYAFLVLIPVFVLVTFVFFAK